MLSFLVVHHICPTRWDELLQLLQHLLIRPLLVLMLGLLLLLLLGLLLLALLSPAFSATILCVLTASDLPWTLLRHLFATNPAV